MNAKSVLFLLISVILFLSSCEKDPLDSPGNISGMGSAPGDLQVKAPFILPQGVEYVDMVHEISYVDTSKRIMGGGYGAWISLSLSNSTDEPKTVFLPKGLLWKCSSSDNHNAILLQTTWVNIEPNSVKCMNILLYCVNWYKPTSSYDISFDLIGVTSSQTITNLLDLISWRKINYEMIYGTIEGVTTAPYSGPTYTDITKRLQDILLNLTQLGVDISDEDRSFIESIPELSPAETPSSLDDGYQFPQFVVE